LPVRFLEVNKEIEINRNTLSDASGSLQAAVSNYHSVSLLKSAMEVKKQI
jgi:hypothetical protein